jgi:2'-5' RNA ligase
MPASAIIVRARLPSPLERARRSWVAEAARGLPAHLTLLYPFVEPSRLDAAVRRIVVAVAERRAPIDYLLTGLARWPGVLYVAVDPVEPFVAIHSELAAAFSAYPIYGETESFDFVPHITIAEAPEVDLAEGLVAESAASTRTRFPRPARATALEVIADNGHGWRVVWRIPLGGRGAGGAR